MRKEFDRHRLRELARKRRVRRFLKPLPRRANINRYPVIRWFAEAARSRPYLWSFRQGSVRRALYVGAVLALLPLYGIQLPLAFVAALLVRGNLTVMVALQMITNPLTIGPLYYVSYRVGAWLIGTTGFGEGVTALGTRMNALFLGGIVLGLATAVAIDVLWRLIAWESRRFKAQMQRLRHAVERAKHENHDARAGE